MPKSAGNRSRVTLDVDKYSDKYLNYSDNFESDDGRSTRITTKESRGGERSFKKAQSNKGHRTNQTKRSPRSQYPAKRKASPKLMRSSEFRGRIAELEEEAKEIKIENRILKKQERMQEKSINKYENARSNLPAVLKSQISELRNLKEQMKKQEEIEEDLTGKLKDGEIEIKKMKKELKKLKKITEENHILERIELRSKLEKMENKARQTEKKADSMELCLENSKNNHTHEITSFKGKYKRLLEKIDIMEEDTENLKAKLKEREKELDIRSIYCKRIIKMPHKLPTSVSPVLSSPRYRSNSLKSLTRDIEKTGRENYFIYDDKVRKNYKLKKEEFEKELKDKCDDIDNFDYSMFQNQRKHRSSSKAASEGKATRIGQRRREESVLDELEEIDRKRRELEEIAYKERILQDRQEQEEKERLLKEAEAKQRKLENEKKTIEEKLKKELEEKEKAQQMTIDKQKRKQLNALKEKLSAMDAEKNKNPEDKDLWNKPIDDALKEEENSYFSPHISMKKTVKKNLLSAKGEKKQVQANFKKPKEELAKKSSTFLDDLENQVEELVL